ALFRTLDKELHVEVLISRIGAAASMTPSALRDEAKEILEARCFTTPGGRFPGSLRGFGALYVDNQPCNLESYKLVASQLMRSYGVSRTVASIRLESLGLLPRRPHYRWLDCWSNAISRI